MSPLPSYVLTVPVTLIVGFGTAMTELNALPVPFWQFALRANQLVYDFGESINRWKSADVAADAANQSVHVTEAQVAYNARVAFFTARAAKDMVGDFRTLRSACRRRRAVESSQAIRFRR